MNSTPTVGVFIFKDDKVLMVKHGESAGHPTGSYGIPAGRIAADETELHAAVRELQEETGLITTESELKKLPIHIPPVYLPRKDGTKKRFTITVFLCRNYSGQLETTDETIPEWVPVSEIEKYPLIGYTKQIIEEGKTYA